MKRKGPAQSLTGDIRIGLLTTGFDDDLGLIEIQVDFGHTSLGRETIAIFTSHPGETCIDIDGFTNEKALTLLSIGQATCLRNLLDEAIARCIEEMTVR